MFLTPYLICPMKKISLLSLLAFLLGLSFSTKAQTVTRIAGGYFNDGGPASSMPMQVNQIAYTNKHLYFLDVLSQAVYRIDSGKAYMEVGVRGVDRLSHLDSTFMDSAVATHKGIIVGTFTTDRLGNIYCFDGWRNRIVKKDTQGALSLVAGNGKNNTTIRNGMAATAVSIGDITSMAVDTLGNLYYSDVQDLIYKINVNGTIQLIAGADSNLYRDSVYNHVPALNTRLMYPDNLIFDSKGNLIGQSAQKIFKITPDGYFSNRALSFDLQLSGSMTADKKGYVYAVNFGKIYKIDSSLTESYYTSAIPNTDYIGVCYISPDTFYINRTRSNAVSPQILTLTQHTSFRSLYGMKGIHSSYDGWTNRPWFQNDYENYNESYTCSYIDDRGNYISTRYNPASIKTVSLDSNNRIHEVNTQKFSGIVANSFPYGHYFTISNQKIYITNLGTYIEVYAGQSSGSDLGDGGPAIDASIMSTGFGALAMNKRGELIINDELSIRKIDNDKIITRIAGRNYACNDGDGGPASSACIWGKKIAIGADNSIYFITNGITSIRKIDANGIINTIAGAGSDSSDNIPATSAVLGDVNDFAIDTSGNIFLAVQGQGIKMVDREGKIRLLSKKIDSIDYASALVKSDIADMQIPLAIGLAIDDSGNLFFENAYLGVVNRLKTFYRFPQPDTTKLASPFDLQLYPNPANSEIHVKCYTQVPGAVDIGVYDVVGRQLSMFQTSTTDGALEATIALPRGLQAGIYFLKLETPYGEEVMKFVVQH